MNKEKRHEAKRSDIKKKEMRKCSASQSTQKQTSPGPGSACGRSGVHVSWPYLLSKPPSLIVRPGLLDAAPQVGALRVELPC